MKSRYSDKEKNKTRRLKGKVEEGGSDVKTLTVPKPLSCGILLTYRCTNECKHCMYACSPKWSADWLVEPDAEKILAQLSGQIEGSPLGPDKVGVNYGLHFTGGEPFLNFNLLLNLTEMAHELKIPSIFVETNCVWCTSKELVKKRFSQLRDKGLNGLLISANPFVVEQVPFERIEQAIKIGKEVFNENLMVYHDLFYSHLRTLQIKHTLSFNEYFTIMRKNDILGLHQGLTYPSIFPMARVPYKLGHLYRNYPEEVFFGESCREELTSPWHIHIDNYCNYITGYCGGISLGDARDLDSIYEGIDLEDYSIVARLVSPRGIEELYRFGVEEFGYRELREGYVSKCHICVDIRKHISEQTDEFKELRPVEFYRSL